MPKLPTISGREIVKALSKLGYIADHQTGSHVILRHKDPPYRRLTVPNHKEVSKRIKRLVNISNYCKKVER